MKSSVVLLPEEEPIQFSCLAPLSLLAEVLSHEQKLFAAVAKHIGVAGAEIRVLVDHISGHLVDHGAL